eukprot:CAMPEP_0205833064 /NCGR_PEP_ID=MMETSP0206-20130828/48655_1 /ASSEMBLY_ACC=CAM_ASM_000279 /TAXON_ID=36767 /ORGANISM="Euplotes focardii, Strain TN1" /LENGTH=141 /DNA_ID=CAMNT_0053139121 /DNA_START=131 /DNA_END=554 /DNA_ORIENTATION=+
MKTSEDAKAAISIMHQGQIDGNYIQVIETQKSKPPQQSYNKGSVDDAIKRLKGKELHNVRDGKELKTIRELRLNMTIVGEEDQNLDQEGEEEDLIPLHLLLLDQEEVLQIPLVLLHPKLVETKRIRVREEAQDPRNRFLLN